VSEARFLNQINTGVEWSATLPYRFPRPQYGIGLNGWGEFAPWYLVFADPLGGAPWTSPPLALGDGDSGRTRTTVGGVDMHSYKLDVDAVTTSVGGVQLDVDNWDLVTALGAGLAVTILFNAGTPRFDIESWPPLEETQEERARQRARAGQFPYTQQPSNPGQGGTIGNQIARVLRDSGGMWRVNNDHIEVLPADISQAVDHVSALNRPLDINDTREGARRGRQVHQVVLVKTGSSPTTRVFDATSGGTVNQSLGGDGLRFPRAEFVNIDGSIDYAKFTDQAGDVVAWYGAGAQAPTSTEPATNVEFGVTAGGSGTLVRLVVHGTPPNNDQPWIPGGNYTYGWTSSYPTSLGGLISNRRKRNVIPSRLWDNQAVADQIAPWLLIAERKGEAPIRRVCKLDPYATFGLPGYIVPADNDAPEMFVESIEMVVSEGQQSMTLAGSPTS